MLLHVHNIKHVLCSNVSLLKASSQSVPSLKELSESNCADNHIIEPVVDVNCQLQL